MKIFLARHGETIENSKGIVQGHDPGTLSPLGKGQAIKLSLRFLKEDFDAIYTSDLARAADTAQAVADYHPGTPFYKTSALRERRWGAHEGRTHKDILAAAGVEPGGKLPLTEGAETLPELYTRAGEFLRELYTKHENDTLLLVGHNGINKALLFAMTGEDPISMLEKKIGTTHMDNTNVSIITLHDKSYEIELLNDTSHLR